MESLIPAWLHDGWPQFGASYIAAWALAAALPLAGIPVVAREQALLGVGLVQIGACGVALALACAWPFPAAWAFLAIAAATLLAQRPPPRERPEAVAAWMILAGSAFTVLALARHPQAAERMAQLQASSVLGATWAQAAVAIGAAVATLAVVVFAGRRLLLAAWEPGTARIQGSAPPLLTIAAALGLALLLATSLKITGALFTTALLVLPVLISRRLLSRLAPLPWLAVILAEAAVTTGFALSWTWDLPPAQVAVAILGLLLAATWVWPPAWRR